MDEELEAAAQDHAVTLCELATLQTQSSDEVARAAASVGVQLTGTPSASYMSTPGPGADPHQRTGED